MLTIEQAQAAVLSSTWAPRPVRRPAIEALGLVLAEDVASDLDMPPFTKALVDGYAVRSADLASGRGTLTVIEEVVAGRTPARTVEPGTATRIMTGAPVPAGADAVVMVERTEPAGGDRVRIADERVRPGQNILPRASEMARGATVLQAGQRVRPVEAGLLGAVGRTTVAVYPRPRVAILSTGDELVPPDRAPGPGQIRNSNGWTLWGQVGAAGGVVEHAAIAGDSAAALGAAVERGLEADILVLSGGVSAGKLDLVPGVLRDRGVTEVFHHVALKPGKPLWFGQRAGERPALVFGLPGNPVSVIVGFELFVVPAIRRLLGCPSPAPRMVQARLSRDASYRTDRPTYHPARLRFDAATAVVEPVSWAGSTDLRGLAAANAFVVFPVGDGRHRAGDVMPVLVPAGELV